MTRARNRQPVVGVLANCGSDGNLATQVVDKKYIDALHEVAGLSVVIIPTLGDPQHLRNILSELDGIVLTGAVSNVHPRFFATEADEGTHAPFDVARDKAALRLIKLVIDRDIPLLAICRGFQELNVACGGTLTPDIFASGQHKDHHPWPKDQLPDTVYGPAHEILPTAGSWIESGGIRSCSVNSVHVQAIASLGEGLDVDAFAADGTIEAISRRDRAFVLGVQWHPEFEAHSNPLSRLLFGLFAQAVAKHSEAKTAALG